MSARAVLMMGLVVLTGLQACGFAGDAQFEAREPDGVTRFSDDRPVEICQQGARVGVPTQSPLGWCDYAAATAPTCNSDGDCRSRERCVCGACVVGPCDSNEECGPGQLCDFNDRRCDRACTNDGDCGAGELCLPGRNVCRGRCQQNADCQSGEHCNAGRGRCEVESCTDQAQCACGLVREPAELGAPSVVALGEGPLQLWFEERRPTGPVLRYAVGDGVQFVLADGTVTDGASPSVVALSDGSLDLVWQTAGGLRAGRVVDGVLISSAPLAAPLVEPTHLLDGNGRRLLFGRRADGAIVAATDDALLDGAAIVPADLVSPPYVLAASAVGAPFVERDARAASVVRLWLTVRAVESGPTLQFGQSVDTPENDSIALLVCDASLGSDCRAGPFVPFPYNPVLARTESITKHPFERAPSTIVHRGVRLLYYESAGLDGLTPGNLRVARSP